MNVRALAVRLLPPLVTDWVRHRRLPRDLPDRDLYTPLFSPWLANEFDGLFQGAAPFSLLDRYRSWVVCESARQASALPGEFCEMGVYRGGTAMILRSVIGDRPLHLFDTFAGMPSTGIHDEHVEGDFGDVSVDDVRSRIPETQSTIFHVGRFPETFAGCDWPIAFAHIDADIYQSVLDASAFCYEHLVPGGIIIYDDYGYPSCPGARRAVDEFYADKPERPLVLNTGQAIVTRLR